MLDKSSDR